MEELRATEEELDELFRQRKVILNIRDKFEEVGRRILSFQSNQLGKGECECFLTVCKKFIYLQICPVTFEKDIWDSFTTFES
jgi:hypothetical protein